MKRVYLIRHSGSFVDLVYDRKITFKEKSNNMILSLEGEEKARCMGEYFKDKDIDVVYSSNSFRAIGTAKYIGNNINVEDDFNEREFGVKYIEDLPDGFIVKQFLDDTCKLDSGESLDDVKRRVSKSFKKILENDEYNDVVIVLHGIVLMVFLKMFCDVSYDGISFKIKLGEKIVYDDMIKAPDIFKLELDGINLVSLENVKY